MRIFILIMCVFLFSCDYDVRVIRKKPFVHNYFHVFELTRKKVWPATGEIVIKVYECEHLRVILQLKKYDVDVQGDIKSR